MTKVIKAHITGNVWKIEVKIGDAVEEGTVVAILESMKMEMPVEAEDEHAGVVTKVLVNEGQAVKEGEPLVEIEERGVRYGFGPVGASDIEGLVKAGLFNGKPLAAVKHPLALGPVDKLSYFKRQTRLTFARCGITDPISLEDYRAHGGYKGLEKAISIKPIEIVEEVTKSGLRVCRKTEKRTRPRISGSSLKHGMTTATDSRPSNSACWDVTVNAFCDQDKTNWSSTNDSVTPHVRYIGML